MSIEPDIKDWTWVIDRPCDDCGYDASAVRVEQIPDLVHENTRGWFGALDDADFAVRPCGEVWSRLEYACHVRDVHRVFLGRLDLMLTEDDPVFENWDQDATAVEEGYAEADPDLVSVELIEAAAEVAARYAGVEGAQWDRTGRRSNGAVFSVRTLGLYHLHDIAHHLHDVGLAPVMQR